MQQIAADARKLGVEIINATKESAIKYFPYGSLEKLV